MKTIEKTALIFLLIVSCAAVGAINIAIFFIEDFAELPLEIISVSATNEAPNYEANRVLDGDTATIWHTAWVPSVVPLPQSLDFVFAETVKINAISVLPRQDMENGRITEYVIYAEDNTGRLIKVTEGTWDYISDIDYKTAVIDPPVTTTRIRLEVNGGMAGFASAAEVRFTGLLTGYKLQAAIEPEDEDNTADIPEVFSDIPFEPIEGTSLTVFADDENHAYPGRYILNGDFTQFWHNDWETGDMVFPHKLYINLGGEYNITAIRFADRQDGNLNGNIITINLYSDNGLIAANITPTDTVHFPWREIPLKKSFRASVIVLEVTDGFGGFASMAELSVLTEKEGVITPMNAFEEDIE